MGQGCCTGRSVVEPVSQNQNASVNSITNQPNAPGPVAVTPGVSTHQPAAAGVEDKDFIPIRTTAKPIVFFVLGGPGSGKGTLCANLVKKQKFVHFSAGDLLREVAKEDSEDSKLVNSYISQGKIVPVRITISLIENAMRAKGWEKCRYLIDGFPRNLDNYQGWNEVIGDKADLKGIIFITCTEETMMKRILKRGETSGRVDDNVDTAKKRFVTYNSETFPIIEAKRKENPDSVFEVSAENSPDQVYAECMKKIAHHL